MNTTASSLAALVPGVYFARDRAPGGPQGDLEALLEVLSGALGALDQAVAQLDDDHFAERASGLALDRLARLVGAVVLTDDVRIKRGVVARTIGWRRRNGTQLTLEEVISVTTGWSAEVDEAFRSLLLDQDLRNLVPWRGRTVVLWDPIALADPLSRRAPEAQRPRGGATRGTPLLAPLPGEEVEDTLRRLGRADAGRHAASPRTLDLAGWARPEVALVRTARLKTFAVARAELSPGRTIPHRDPLGSAIRVVDLDPQGRRVSLAWEQPLESPYAIGALTAAHEPEPDPPTVRSARTLLTPTALAAAGDEVEASGAFSLRVDGVLMVGPDPVDPGEGAQTCSGPGSRPVLRFADRGRPSPGETWQLHLLSVGDPDTLDLGPPNVTDAALDNVAVSSTTSSRNVSGPVTPHLVGGIASGAWLRVARAGAPTGYQRDAAGGAWTTLALAAVDRSPLSGAAVVERAGERFAWRAVRGPDGQLDVSLLRLAAATGWEAGDAVGADLPAVDPDVVGPDLAVASADAEVVLVGVRLEDSAAVTGAWRAGADLRELVRLDDSASPRRPLARSQASACIHAGRLYVFGGMDGEVPLGDLWSLPLGGGSWQSHPVRGGGPRAGGILLSTPAGLVLLGGAAVAGRLEPSVLRCDPSRRRPVWRELPPLPIPEDAPGTLAARIVGDALEVVVWADRTAPTGLRLEAGAEAWTVGVPEPQAPNPPAEGEAVWDGGRLLLLGPSPLPASEIVASVDGEGVIGFLPALDLPLDGDAALFELLRDGSTRRWAADGEGQPHTFRLGLARREDWPVRTAPSPRFGLTGRLAWAPLRLRQRNLEPLGPGALATALRLDEIVALDPRVGRVALREDLASDQLEVSVQRARSAGIGAGLAPWDRRPHPWWVEHDPALQAPVPPDLDHDAPGGPASTGAFVSPARAGTGGGTPVVGTVEEALAIARVVTVLGSPRLPPVHLPAGPGSTVLIADGAGGVPWIEPADGVSLWIEPVLDDLESPAAEPPVVHLCGLELGGRLEVALQAGVLDLRWCTLGLSEVDFVPPTGSGEVPRGLRVAGAGHQSALARRSLPEATLTLFLTGCLVGRLELPPWVQLVAAGCTFDGGLGGTAIVGAGARARLRHCTVHGAVELGLLEASSCAFTDPVTVDRPDLGWVRYSVLPAAGRPPLQFRCLDAPLSLQSLHPTDPTYLLLAADNLPAVSTAGEAGRLPGAHADRSDSLRELEQRTTGHLPMGMAPHHLDRAVTDLARMRRRHA